MFIILLNWNGYSDTRECLLSLRRLAYPSYHTIVVDNASNDGSPARLREEFPEVTLLQNEQNLGFTGGNNVGIAHALHAGADYVLLLNNDTVVDPAMLGPMVEAAEGSAQVGIVGPKIFYFDQPDRIWYAGGQVNRITGKFTHVGLDEVDGSRFAQPCTTGFVTGCALLAKAEVVRRIGMLDPRLFVYSEDSDFCLRARNAGYACQFVPQAKVWHKISRTCGAQSPFTLYLGTRNQLLVVATNIPYPLRLVPLSCTLAKKVGKMIVLFLTRGAEGKKLAKAVGQGIAAFMFRRYGPPPKKAALTRA